MTETEIRKLLCVMENFKLSHAVKHLNLIKSNRTDYGVSPETLAMRILLRYRPRIIGVYSGRRCLKRNDGWNKEDMANKRLAAPQASN